MIRITILDQFDSTLAVLARYQLQSRVSNVPDAVKSPDGQSFYFDVELPPEKVEEVRKWMEYCGYELNIRELSN